MIERRRPTLTALLNGEIVEIEGLRWRALPDVPIKDNDWYVGERNTPVTKVLTARKVDHMMCWIVPKEIAYVYDISECVKVEMVED